jgi:tetraacyldisaccharide 4'-kinase
MRAPEVWDAPPGLAAGLLAPFGVAWNAASRLHRAVARGYRAPVPVICIGNLIAGGSGKTPVVLSLAGIAGSRDTAVHIVTRGYGGRLAGPIRVDPREHDADAVGDEPLLLAARAPCWVARDRASGIRAAVRAGAEAVLLDDGFQNPTIEKNLSLVVIDADYGFGNGRVIPAGPLREPVVAGLGRADAIVLIGDAAAPAELQAARRPIFLARLEPIRAERFSDVPVIGFAGIGRPAKFFATLRRTGAELIATHPFPDHHRYAEGEIVRLWQGAERAGARLVTTAKDWARLPPYLRRGVEVLEVEIRWRDPAAIAALLSSILDRTCDGNDRGAARR